MPNGIPARRPRHYGRRFRTVLFVSVLALLAAVPAIAADRAAADPTPPVVSPPDTPLPAGTYCNQTPTQPGPDPSSYNGPTKVLQIFEENESSSIVNADTNDDADFELNTLGSQCGVLSNAHGETHGSETNYLDDVDGGNNPQWTLCDHAPNRAAGTCPYGASSQITAPSIFSQVESKDGANGWRVYGQDQTANCQLSDGAGQQFVVRHNAPQFFTGVNCAANDIPSGAWRSQQGQFYQDVVTGNLPAFGMYTPNDTDDGHDPSTYDQPSVNVSNLDNALANLMALVQSGPDYQAGRLIVMVTFDEGTTTGRAPYTDARTGEDCADPSQGDTKPSCQILTYVAGRYVPWSNDSDFTTHYSMLKTTQQILGLTPQNGYAWLGHAGDMLTNDFYDKFKLAPDSWSTAQPPPSPPTVPSAPTAVSASAGNANATVSFTPPASSGGASISSYTVTSSPGAVVATGRSTPIVVTGLTNATSYTFTVTATNSFGAGAPSAATTAVTPMGVATGPELLPDPGFEAGNGGWVAFKIGTLSRVSTPVHGGGHALQVVSPQSSVSLVGLTQNSVVSNSVAGQTYTASCYVQPTTANLNVQIRLLEYTQDYGTNTQISQTVLASLPVNTWTLARVSGVAASSGHRVIPQIYSTKQTSANGNLRYDDCSVQAGVPVAVTPPGPPTAVSATPGDTTATVAFTAPAATGGAAVTGYTVTSSPGGLTATGTAGPLTVAGLTDGTSYTFTVRATNSAGPGPASAPSNSVTPTAATTVPGAPSAPVATAGDGQIALSWTAPAGTGGSAITDYVVAYSVAGQNNWSTVDGGSAATSATITGLTDGTSYDFEVQAVNAVGPGAFSGITTTAPVAAPPPATVPGAAHGRAGHGRRRDGHRLVHPAGRRRRGRHHRLHGDGQPGWRLRHGDRESGDGDRPDQRHQLHVHGHGDERRGPERGVGTEQPGDAGGHPHRPRRTDRRGRDRRQRPGRPVVDRTGRRRRIGGHRLRRPGQPARREQLAAVHRRRVHGDVGHRHRPGQRDRLRLPGQRRQRGGARARRARRWPRRHARFRMPPRPSWPRPATPARPSASPPRPTAAARPSRATR